MDHAASDGKDAAPPLPDPQLSLSLSPWISVPNSLIPLCVLLACRSNPIGDVLPLFQIEVVGVGGRRAARWCRTGLQRAGVERIPHMCRGNGSAAEKKSLVWIFVSKVESVIR